ncbi:MAG: tRNA lysidine(34) synthetase TilS [Chitinivibrionia bacterium]|nr:tRNA lysidine(34) synthetase TilS [Chitinivibrionia bacterium]
MSVLLKIKDFFSKNSISDCKIAVALSGGTDSTALFFLLLELAKSFNLQICALHINYNLRGKDSEDDEKFVRKLCEENDVELFVKFMDMSKFLSKIEETARNERYKFFSEMQKEKNIKYVATAHNANDQAETLLFRLARKTGILGATSIMPIREDGIIRPLLNVTRNEIITYLTENKHFWRNDKTNADVKFSRNRIRANVIPELEKINPAAVINIAQFCDFLRKFAEKNEKLSEFLINKKEKIDIIKEKCYENGLILNENHCANIEKCKENTGAIILLPDFKMFVLKNLLFFKKNGDNSFEIKEITIKEEDKNLFVGKLWKIVILDEIPKKGENFAVIQKSDYPLKIKKLSTNDYLKNDEKTAFERMKKVGLSKFERENSPAIFSSNGDLLAAAFVSWKFDNKVKGFRWLKVENVVEY